MKIYKTKIQFKKDMSIAELKTLIQRYVDKDCETIDVQNNGDELIGYRSKQGDLTTDIILAVSQDQRYLVVKLKTPSPRSSEFVAKNIPTIVAQLHNAKPFPIDTSNYMTSLGNTIDINHSKEFRDKCIEMMLGGGEGVLPLIYISRYNKDNAFAVDTARLAKLCAGLACVVVEDDCKKTSYELGEQTGKRRACNGYIGVYYPHLDTYTHILSQGNESEEELEYRVFDCVRKWWTEVEDSGYSWRRLVRLKERDDMHKLTHDIDQENKQLKNDNEQLSNDKQKLKAELFGIKQDLEQLKMRYDELVNNNKGSSKSKLIEAVDIREFFVCEQYDLVVSALMYYCNNWVQEQTRAKELAQALVANNPIKGKGKGLFDDLLKILTKSPEINASTESELRKLGFELERDTAGKHNKLVYQNNDNYRFEVSCTPSSTNTPKETVKKIKKRLNIYVDNKS